MSTELIDSLMGAAAPRLGMQFKGLAGEFLDGLQDTVAGLEGPVREKVQGHLEKAAEFRYKAIQQKAEDVRRAYVEGSVDELHRAKTVLVSEAVAISEEQAGTITAAFGKALDFVGSAAKGLITVIVSGLASGAIKGLTGGDGPDLSSIFPGA